MLVAVLHFIPDEFTPVQVITTLIDALPGGSGTGGVARIP